MGNVQSPINCMSLDSGRNLEYPERMQTPERPRPVGGVNTQPSCCEAAVLRKCNATQYYKKLIKVIKKSKYFIVLVTAYKSYKCLKYLDKMM